jgi:PAS domain S-box-containing protein
VNSYLSQYLYNSPIETSMIKTFSTPAKLYIMVFIMFSLITVIGIYGIVEMKDMTRNTESLLADRMVPLQQLTEIRYAYSTGILATDEELETHPNKIDLAKKRIEDAEMTIDKNWKAYQKTFLTDEEAGIVKQTIQLKSNADKAISSLKIKLQNLNKGRTDGIMDESMYAAVSPVVEKINELVQIQIKISNTLNSDNKVLFASATKKIFVLILLSLLFSGLLAFYIIGNTREFIEKLKFSNFRIKQAEEKYRTFIRHAADAIFILNQDLQITEVNESAGKLLGYLPEELCKMSIPDLIAPEEFSVFENQLEFLKKAGSSLHERKFVKKDGSVLETEVNVRALEGIGYITIMRDITERNKAIVAVRESEEKYRYLFQNNPAYIIIWDLETLTVKDTVTPGMSGKKCPYYNTVQKKTMKRSEFLRRNCWPAI